jgi:hypothetical protein
MRAALPGQHYAVDELRDNVGHDGNNAAGRPVVHSALASCAIAERAESSGSSNRLCEGISQLAQSTVDQAVGQWLSAAAKFGVLAWSTGAAFEIQSHSERQLQHERRNHSIRISAEPQQL